MATKDKRALTLGSCNLRVNGRLVGHVDNVQVLRDVEKLAHDTNTTLEFTTDYVVPLKTSFSISGTFGEVSPHVMNLLLGQPGYSFPSLDKHLPGRDALSDLSDHSALPYVEYPQFADTLDGLPKWVELLYTPIVDAAASNPPSNPMLTNTEVPGAPIGYLGAMATAKTAGGAVSLPSEISVKALYAADDDMTFAWAAPPAGGGVAATYTIWLASFAIGTDGILRQSSAWQTFAAGTDILIGASPLAFKANVVRAVTVFTSAITVTSADGVTPYAYGTDYLVDLANRKIIRVTAGAIGAWETVKVTYYYDSYMMVEAPLHPTGENPLVTVVLDHTYPDRTSRLVICLWKAQINTRAQISFSERDWMGIPFELVCLSDEEEYPDFAFGYIQFLGTIANRVAADGNFPFIGADKGAYQEEWG